MLVQDSMRVLLFLVYVLFTSSKSFYSSGGARNRFEHKFNQTCAKYSFVPEYFDMLDNPRDDYLIFVFHEAGQSSHGGLGDRLAGMVTALAYAIRTKRTFMIQGDQSFEESFKPYHPKNPYSWSSWDWAKWKREYSANMTRMHCVNPKPFQTQCALDDIDRFSQYKVIKYYGNRSYLCRWNLKKGLGITEEIAKSLNIQTNSDLYEIAGCLLRLAIWPTDKLWNALDETLESQFTERKNAETSLQVGFHFRCGDSSFHNNEVKKVNPECFYDPNIPWKGTSFSDDHAIDSPVDIGLCGKKIFNSKSNLTETAIKTIELNEIDELKKQKNIKKWENIRNNMLAYIASDNIDSSFQINKTLNWKYTIRPPQGCHMDISKNSHCTLITALHWFMLSLSDIIIMQALIKPKSSPFENSLETAYLAVNEESAPVSAFSRYAAIYSLSNNVIRYGKDCNIVNQTRLSHQTHGNWVCDPKVFF